MRRDRVEEARGEGGGSQKVARKRESDKQRERNIWRICR